MPTKKKRHSRKKKSPKQVITSHSHKERKHTEILTYDVYLRQSNHSLSVENDPCTSYKIFKRADKTQNKSKVDSNGVKRIYLPFNKFSIKKRFDVKKKMSYPSQYKVSGLSPKEKSYIICSCQTRSNRYANLKKMAADAIKNNKIFSIYGSCNPVRKSLLERGWVEKIQAHKMNLSKIRNGTFKNQTEVHSEIERLMLSNLVERHSPNFVWSAQDAPNMSTTIDMNIDCIINKLDLDALFTSKQGLCSSMKRNYWFYIEDVAEVNGPRTYNTSDTGEIDSFVRDFKITACTSLLKWILSMVANEHRVFDNSGKISTNVLVFALNRCKEYLFRKQNRDIDHNISGASSAQWNSFLKKYYSIISKVDVFQTDRDNKVPMYLDYAKILLKEMQRYRPQLKCEGCLNIWIIKPTHNSRGRGIRMASKLGVITNLLNKANSKYVIQKYVEEPLLIHETKFDIRQYYLVTSTYPLIVWMYRDCYLKFSSQKYNLKNYHESIHLTNNAVQRKYINCSNRHPDLPQHNMWDLDTYKEYLSCMGKTKVWDNIIYPGMRKSIVGIMLNCQDSLTLSRHRFELYGCDFILDKEYQPWLIEINSCPDLNHTTQVTSKICPAVISDIIKVVIDHAADSSSPTGKFECVYHQPMTIPRYGGAADLVVRGYALPNEYFYKGTVELKDSFEFNKDSDMKEVLNKLKGYYDLDIMVAPDDMDDNINLKHQKIKETTACAHITKSENELNTVAKVITGQLEDLFDRITSDNTGNSKSLNRLESTDCLAINSCSGFKIKSLTDVLSLIKKSANKFPSSTNINESFRFSEIDDDGPSSKGGFFHYQNLKNVLFNMDLAPVKEKYPQINMSPVVSKTNNFIDDSVTKATSKFLTFINDKEKEYSNGWQPMPSCRLKKS